MENFTLPDPIIDSKEAESIEKLQKRYEKLSKPGLVSKAGGKIANAVPGGLKKGAKNLGSVLNEKVGKKISEQAIYEQAMNVIGKGFSAIVEKASPFTINESQILKSVNGIQTVCEITSVDEICLLRSYDLSKAAAKFKTEHRLAAVVEGAGTGTFGFAGIPFNIVLSMFLYYRAVQTIAMLYGYDIKNDITELTIAGHVLTSAMIISEPAKEKDEIGNLIEEIMQVGEESIYKREDGTEGDEELQRLLIQLQQLAEGESENLLENAGKQGMEQNVFRNVFEQVGKKLILNSAAKVIPVASGVVGAFADTTQMNQVIEYADVFYNKRYLLEKEERIQRLLEKKEAAENDTAENKDSENEDFRENVTEMKADADDFLETVSGADLKEKVFGTEPETADFQEEKTSSDNGTEKKSYLHFCSNCGSKLEARMKFCPNCGKAV